MTTREFFARACHRLRWRSHSLRIGRLAIVVCARYPDQTAWLWSYERTPELVRLSIHAGILTIFGCWRRPVTAGERGVW